MKTPISILAACIAATIPTVASAQTDEQSALLEEVLVTSTRREKAVMDISQSIQAVTSATLDLPTFTDMTQIHDLIPGATSFSNKSPIAEGIQLRGSGILQSGSADGQSPVGYYVDDIPYVDISTPVPPPVGTFDLERIEILRGPQGTSYGQDSTAGSVIMRTKAVDLENVGYNVRAGASKVDGTNGNGYNVGGVVNIPIVKDTMGVRISYQKENNPGYGRVEGRPDIKNPLESTRDSFRIKAFWNVTDWMDLELTHSQWNTEYNLVPGTQILDSSKGEMVLRPVETPMLLELFPDGRLKNDFEIKWTTALARFDLGFAELTSSTGFVDTPKKETFSEFDFWGAKTGVMFNQPAESLTQELRLVSTTEGNLHWIAGVFYLDAESSTGGFNETPAYSYLEFVSDPIESETQSIFGEIEYELNDQWSLQAGLRYHDEERRYTTTYASQWGAADDPFDPKTYTTVPLSTTVENHSFDHTSYRFGVDWTPADNGLVYLTHSTSHRAPIVPDQEARDAIGDAGLVGFGNTDSAELRNTELGTKWTLADGRVQLEAAYVYGDWKEIPLWARVTGPTGNASLAIGGTDATVETLELAVTWAITDNLRLNYAFTNTETEVQKTPDPAVVTRYPSAVYEGGELYQYAPQTHNIGLNFNHSLNNGWELYSSLNYVTRDKPNGIDVFFSPDAYIPARDRYENMSFNLGLNINRWDVSLGIQNLTNDNGQYMPRTANGGDDAKLFGMIQQPRTVSLQITYDAFQ